MSQEPQSFGSRMSDRFASFGSLESYLGDPEDPSVPFSYSAVMGWDEREQFPQVASDLLDEWGFDAFYVPADAGGRLSSYEEVIALLRAVARRDLTTAIAHAKTYLGSVAVWVAGSADLRQEWGRRVREHHRMCLALTEKDHGSDLASSELRASPDGAGYRLSGEKWLINNGNRAHGATVLARTSEGGGARGMGVFAVLRDRLRPAEWLSLPKVRTHGIRGRTSADSVWRTLGSRARPSWVPPARDWRSS